MDDETQNARQETAEMTCATCTNQGYVQVCNRCSLQPQQPRTNRYRRDPSHDCPVCQEMKDKRAAMTEIERIMSAGTGPRYCGGDACRNDPVWQDMD